MNEVQEIERGLKDILADNRFAGVRNEYMRLLAILGGIHGCDEAVALVLMAEDNYFVSRVSTGERPD
jgi:hypothetical protein